MYEHRFTVQCRGVVLARTDNYARAIQAAELEAKRLHRQIKVFQHTGRDTPRLRGTVEGR